MLITTSAEALIKKERVNPEALKRILNVQVDRARRVLANRKMDITDDTLRRTVAFLNEQTGLLLTVPQMREVCRVFPELRTTILTATPDENSVVGELLLDCMSNMLLGCEYSSNPKIHQMLRDQAEKVWTERTA